MPDLYPQERTAIFIDGTNLFAAARSLGLDIDYRKLIDHFRQRSRFIRALYYTAVIDDDEFSSVQPLVDWLEYNGYTVITKAAKQFTDDTGRRKLKRSMNVELAIDAMRLAPHLDHVLLFSGDGSFCALVAALQKQGKRVTVVSTMKTRPAMLADELRRQADQMIELNDLGSSISRIERERTRVRRSHEPTRHDNHDNDEPIDD